MSTNFKPIQENRQLVYNGIQCLNCGAVLESVHRHDYKTCKCPNVASIDGGLDYVRYGARDTKKIRTITYYFDDDFKIVRKFAFRINLEGKTVRLYKMSNQWLDNAIEDMIVRKYGHQWHLLLLMKEKQYRIENEIYIEEDPTKTRKYEALREKLLKKDPSEKGWEEQIDYEHEQGAGW